MAAIQNDRDILLQVANPRVVPIPIPIDQIEGLGPALKSLRIKASANMFMGASGATNPATITLTAEKLGGLTGPVEWSVIGGSATITPSGDTCSVTGSTVVGYTVTIRARVAVGATNYDSQIILSKLGTLSAQETVNLSTQITGQLAMGNVTGYGALALLNQVNLNTQTVGALNGQTQVTNLGTLAYVNSLAANQIGAGTLAAGVIYAGQINADNITAGTLTGRTIQTSPTGRRIVIDVVDNAYRQYDSNLLNFATFDESGNSFRRPRFSDNALTVNGSAGVGLVAQSQTYGVHSTANLAGVMALSPTGIGIIAGGGTTDVSCEASGVLYLKPRASLPPNRAGAVCYYGGWLCFSNGSSWSTSAGNSIT